MINPRSHHMLVSFCFLIWMECFNLSIHTYVILKVTIQYNCMFFIFIYNIIQRLKVDCKLFKFPVFIYLNNIYCIIMDSFWIWSYTDIKNVSFQQLNFAAKRKVSVDLIYEVLIYITAYSKEEKLLIFILPSWKRKISGVIQARFLCSRYRDVCLLI